MDLRTMLQHVCDYQKVTVVVGGECITASSWALYAYLSENALNMQIIDIAAEENAMKVWLKND